jgi:hypothetical protein
MNDCTHTKTVSPVNSVGASISRPYSSASAIGGISIILDDKKHVATVAAAALLNVSACRRKNKLVVDELELLPLPTPTALLSSKSRFSLDTPFNAVTAAFLRHEGCVDDSCCGANDDTEPNSATTVSDDADIDMILIFLFLHKSSLFCFSFWIPNSSLYSALYSALEIATNRQNSRNRSARFKVEGDDPQTYHCTMYNAQCT